MSWWSRYRCCECNRRGDLVQWCKGLKAAAFVCAECAVRFHYIDYVPSLNDLLFGGLDADLLV